MKLQFYELIWAGTTWLSASEIVERAGDQRGVSHALLEQWDAEGRIFGLQRGSAKVYPAYAFAADFTPLPVVARVLQILRLESAEGVASFFESRSGFLGGRRARELVYTDPNQVIAMAIDDWDSRHLAG